MRKNNVRNAAILLPAFILALSVIASCSFERVQMSGDQGPSQFEIDATIPHDGQFNVVLSSGLIIHFTDLVDPISIYNKIHIVDERDLVPEIITDVQDESVVIKPKALWQPRTKYHVIVDSGVRSINGQSSNEQRVITFETGIRRPQTSERLAVTHLMPGPNEPCWDISTFRVFFNQPIKRQSLDYGSSVRMIEKDTKKLIPGNLFGRGNQVVFDPENDLTPGKTYSLIISTDLKDYSGQGMAAEYSVDFIAESSGKRVEMAMDKCPTVVEGTGFCKALPDDALFPKSKFIARELNSMYADSVLLGPTNIKVGSRLWNEFGDGKLHPDRIPFVVRKGQKLYGKGLKGKVGGEITSGVDTGLVTVTILTDAVGELLGSEFVHGKAGLPATITLTMDAVMTAESKTASAILGQPILGATLVGQASVSKVLDMPDYEAMQIEIVGFSEIEVVNEFVPVTMTLKMVPPPIKPEKKVDSEPPQVVAVSPVDLNIPTEENFQIKVPTRMAGDEIIITFSEAIDPNTFKNNIVLKGPSGDVDGTFDFYNPKVAFTPKKPLDPNTSYTVVVYDGIKNILGKKMTETVQSSFTTMPYQSSDKEPPLLNATVPGRFEGATLAVNFFPEIYFSQIVNIDSVIYGDSISIYDDTMGGSLVPATIMYNSIFVRVIPDQDLVVGHQYRLVITPDIENLSNLALDTDANHTAGGRDVTIPFTATPYIPYVQSMFVTYPYADTDVDGFLEVGEPRTETNYMEMDFPPLLHDRSYVMGYFPITIYSMVIDNQGRPRLPIDIQPSSTIYATSVRLDLPGPDSSTPDWRDMKRVTINILDPSSTDLFQADDGLVGVDINTRMNFNVENPLFNSLLDHSTFMQIPSRLRFTEDGRMVVLVQGTSEVHMSIPVLGALKIPLLVDLTTATIPSRRGL